MFLAGAAAKTSGKWRAADLPQWDAGKAVSGNWGGSTDAVLKLSKNQIAASQLALFINTDKQSALKFATKQFLFPAMNEILTDPAFVDQKSDFYGGQKVNEMFAEISTTVSPDFGWLPFMDYVYTNFNETLGKAFADKTDAVAGLQAWQDATRQVRQGPGLHGLLTLVGARRHDAAGTYPTTPGKEHLCPPLSILQQTIASPHHAVSPRLTSAETAPVRRGLRPRPAVLRRLRRR